MTIDYFREISTHALREEGDFLPRDVHDEFAQISTHALREEGDLPPSPSPAGGYYFYPRPPRGGRRRYAYLREINVSISTHALREEGD